MTRDNPYFSVQIDEIPIPNLKEIIRDEILKLMLDFGQKVTTTAPESEFDYLFNRLIYALRNYYPKWRLQYLDECFRKGKLDEYDKGQRVTMKRLEYWLKSYNISLIDRIKKTNNDKVYSPEKNEQFAANGCRFPNIIKFRQGRKPQFDGDEWTLLKIEATPAYQKWLSTGGYRSRPEIESLTYTKV